MFGLFVCIIHVLIMFLPRHVLIRVLNGLCYGYISSGAGESGKSTFIKQMRIIHGAGYTSEDRKGFRILVFENVHKVIRTLCEQMDNLQIEYDLEINAVSHLCHVSVPPSHFIISFTCSSYSILRTALLSLSFHTN